MLKYLVPSRQSCLGRVRRCGLVGGSVLLRLGFEVSEAQAQAVSLSLSAVCGSGYKPLSSRAMPACVATLVATVTVSSQQ